MDNTAIRFLFQYAALKVFGYSSEQSFHLVATEFKRSITAIKLTRRKEKNDSRTYYFKDGTSCVYQDNYFKIHS